MQVRWISADLSQGLGSGVEFRLLHATTAGPLGFISGLGWRDDHHPEVVAYIDSKLGDMALTVTVELRLAMLLFLTDKKRQKNDSVLHGFLVHINT